MTNHSLNKLCADICGIEVRKWMGDGGWGVVGQTYLEGLWNPVGNMNQAMQVVEALRGAGYRWDVKLYPKRPPFVCVQKDGELYLGESNDTTCARAICEAAKKVRENDDS